MWQLMMIGWGAGVGIAVFVLYMRDPTANGMRPPVIEPLISRFSNGLRRIRASLCVRSPSLSACPLHC